MSSAASPVYYDPYKVEITANPYPVFRRLREEAPLYYNEEHDFYAVSRFEDVEKGLADKETYISGRGAIVEIIKANAEFPPGVLIFEDPPIHTAHRGLLARLFTPKRMVSLEAKIREYCVQCLDPLVGRDGFDFIADLGAQMPIRVIGMLLGIPEEDHAAVRERVDATMRTEAGKPMNHNVGETMGSGFEEYVDWRIKHPSDDVMTELLNTEFKDETGTMRRATRDEVLTLVNVLAGAGNETTNRLIGWTGKVLAEHPDQRRQIVANPGLIPQAIEELLRFEPPAPHVARYINRDVEVHGRKIAAGNAMMFLTGSANRDDRRFVNGDTFDIHRQARPHLSFGYGIHACVGAVLARLEGRIALEEVLKRFPEWEVDLERATLSPTSTVRGWETMPAYFKGSGSRPAAPAAQPEPVAPAVPAVPVTTSVDGSWTVTVKGPTGAESTTLVLENVGGKLSGTQSGRGMSSQILDGKFENGKIFWVNQITKPMKMKIEFSGTVEGNSMTGKAKAGFMGSFPFTGTKA
ncbi:MAG TPA: cytochrome P450 [Solimonas sp.]|nr:cytochrome P450 [Solimonas sp.]